MTKAKRSKVVAELLEALGKAASSGVRRNVLTELNNLNCSIARAVDRINHLVGQTVAGIGEHKTTIIFGS